MPASTQLDHDLLRILLYRRHASELLLETDREGLHLPVISVPTHTRVAEQVTQTIKDEWNLDTYCLFPIHGTDSPDASIPFHIVESCNPDIEAPAMMRWLPTTSLSTADFPDQSDFAGIQAALAKFAQYRRGELHGAFAKPGWLQGVNEWVAAQASAARISLKGGFRQFNASPTFSLLRFETDGPALWFKAVGEANIHEFSITRHLARLLPCLVPRVIGWRTDWNAWLSLESEGAHLDDTTPLSAWQRVAAALANLQIASYGHGLHLIHAGCRDIRICSLLSLVDPFFERMTELMELQTKPTPPPLTRAEIYSLAVEVRSLLDELSSGKIPDTLGHLDFNPGNILVSAERCIFLDWAEGSVGHPFFTFQYLLEHWRQFHKTETYSESALVSSYAFSWRAFASPDETAKALALLPLLAAFAYAATSPAWHDSQSCRNREGDRHLRSLVRRMKREGDALREPRVVCLL